MNRVPGRTLSRVMEFKRKPTHADKERSQKRLGRSDSWGGADYASAKRLASWSPSAAANANTNDAELDSAASLSPVTGFEREVQTLRPEMLLGYGSPTSLCSDESEEHKPEQEHQVAAAHHTNSEQHKPELKPEQEQHASETVANPSIERAKTQTLLSAAFQRSDSEFIDSDEDVYRFSLFWEAVLQPFDDPLLKVCQFKTKGFIALFSVLFTFLTAVEAGLNWPVVLYALGYGAAGRVFALMLLTLSVFSQIPKRFVWRPRPWMVNRAKKVRADLTSSFPSRAAACALVFPLLIMDGLQREFGIVTPNKVAVPVVALCILFTGFARINVGAHYPSDILGGIVLGVAVWYSGKFLVTIFDVLTAVASAILPLELRLVVGVLCSFMTTHVFLERFWAKCSFVFGLLFASLTFDFAFIGAHHAGASVIKLGHSESPLTIVAATVCGLVLLGYGMKAHKRKGVGWQIAVFAQIFTASLFAILIFRL